MCCKRSSYCIQLLWRSCKITDLKRRKWLHSHWRADTEVSSSWKVPAQVKIRFLHWKLWKMREGIPIGRSWWPLSAGTGSPCARFAISLTGSAQSLCTFPEKREDVQLGPCPGCVVMPGLGRLRELGGCPCPQNPPKCLLGDLCQDKVLPQVSFCCPI